MYWAVVHDQLYKPETPPVVRIPGQEVGGVSTIPTFAIQYGRLSVFNALSVTWSVFSVTEKVLLTPQPVHTFECFQCHRVSSSMRLWANDANDNSRHVYRTFPTTQIECCPLTCDVRINTLDVPQRTPRQQAGTRALRRGSKFLVVAVQGTATKISSTVKKCC